MALLDPISVAREMVIVIGWHVGSLHVWSCRQGSLEAMNLCIPASHSPRVECLPLEEVCIVDGRGIMYSFVWIS